MKKTQTKKLWQTKQPQNILLEEYCFAKDSILDNKIIVYDVWGSIAHAFMLKKCGFLNTTEFLQLKNALLTIIKLTEQGEFSVNKTDEDVHTKIENFLIETVGESGKKIHTGRSRNDQVLTALRLFTKDQTYIIEENLFAAIFAFLKLAKKYEFIAMPGYTHMQKAMPSSIGLWASSFAESLLDDSLILKTAYTLNDQSPLGSGASYGVSLPIDRALTAKLLGFSKVQNNVLYTNNSRVKMHLSIMHALSQIMLTLSRFAQDMLLFTTEEFNFFTIPQNFTTGSSIMPQKKNMDVCEIIRAKAAIACGNEQTIMSIILGLPSGYNADFGQTKKLFFETTEIILQTLPIITLLTSNIVPNNKNLQKALTPELFATEKAFELVQKGISFREAYHKVKNSLSELKNYNPVYVLKQTNSIGAPGNLQLNKITNQAIRQNKWWKIQQTNFKKTISKLLQKGSENI